MTIAEPLPQPSNPVGIDGIEFIEFATAQPQALGAVLEKIGFHAVARHRSREVMLYRQGTMNLIVNSHGVSEATLYGWKSKYGGMEVGEAQRLKSLEDENRRLKQLVADLSLDREALKAIVRKNGWSLPV